MQTVDSKFGVSNNPLIIFQSNCKSTDHFFNQCDLDYFPYGHKSCNEYNLAGVQCERKDLPRYLSFNIIIL